VILAELVLLLTICSTMNGGDCLEYLALYIYSNS
jgi:hypothetical protein